MNYYISLQLKRNIFEPKAMNLKQTRTHTNKQTNKQTGKTFSFDTNTF